MSTFGHVVLAAVAAVLSVSASPLAAAEPDERRYCFSDICPDDPRNVLSSITLNGLGNVAERPRARPKEYLATFKAALPGLSDAERLVLSAYTDAGGSLLLDSKTLPIFLKIDRVCAPVGPFVALFTSESGHPTSVEFGAIASGKEVGLGITRVARSFQVRAGSVEEKALIADLSQKFGFRIDAAPEKHLVGRGLADVTAQFTRQANGFTLVFNSTTLLEDAVEFADQVGCGPPTRIKVD